MAFEFKSTDKYSDISARTMKALEGSKISDADKELVCEAVYCYQVAIAEKYNLNMDRIYENLKKLESITFLSHADWQRQNRADGTFGVFCYAVNGTDAERPSAIYVDGGVVNSPDARREVLFHELCHCFSMDYDKFEMKIKNSPIDEALNQCATIKMLEECGITFDVQHKQFNLSGACNDNSVNVSYLSNGYSYSTVFVPALEKFYGEETLYKSKFETGALFDKAATLGDLSGAFSGLTRHPFADSQVAAARAIAGVIISKYDKIGANMDNYLEDVRNFRDVCGSISINGNKYSLLDVALENFEIKKFYKESFSDKFIDNTDRTTRSSDCTDFLKMMSLAKQIDGVTIKDVREASTSRGTAKGIDALEVTLAGKTYLTDKFNSCGNFIPQISPGTFEEGHLQSKESVLKGFFGQKDSVKFDLQQVTELTGALMNVTSGKHAAGAISAAIGDIQDKTAVSRAVKSNDVVNITDLDGHNILHIAGASKFNGETIVTTIKSKMPTEFDKMITATDNHGFTPIHSMILHGNMNALWACSDYIKMDKETLSCLDKIVVFDNVEHMKNRGYTGLQLAIMTRPELAQKFISSGADVNMECPNSSILQTAVEAGSLDIVKMVNPQNVDYVNCQNETPLAVACRRTDINARADIIFELLVNKGANPNIETQNGTPLCMYINSEYCRPIGSVDEKRILNELLEAGANPNASSVMSIDYERKEILPLQIAGRVFMTDEISSRENGQKSLGPDKIAITELIRHGADPFMSTADYQSLRDYAAETKNAHIFMAMAEAGVSPELMKLDEVGLDIGAKYRIEKAYEASDKEYSKYCGDKELSAENDTSFKFDKDIEISFNV